jgi:hypothetical protein
MNEMNEERFRETQCAAFESLILSIIQEAGIELTDSEKQFTHTVVQSFFRRLTKDIPGETFDTRFHTLLGAFERISVRMGDGPLLSSTFDPERVRAITAAIAKEKGAIKMFSDGYHTPSQERSRTLN